MAGPTHTHTHECANTHEHAHTHRHYTQTNTHTHAATYHWGYVPASSRGHQTPVSLQFHSKTHTRVPNHPLMNKNKVM